MMFGLTIVFALGVVALLVVALVWMAVSYNGLVVARGSFQTAFGQIEVHLNRRCELILKLVEAARAFMRHERETLEAVLAARNQVSAALKELSANPSDGERIQKVLMAEQGLGGVMGRLMSLSEAYPELKANPNIILLTGETLSAETQVSLSRQNYNQAVANYNSTIKAFPTVLIASFLGFQEANLFELKEVVEKDTSRVRFA